MGVKIDVQPVNVIKANLGINPDGPVMKFFVSTCAKRMDKYVPYRTGTLAKYKIEGNLVIYDTPYAHYMYEGKVMGPNIPIKDKNGNIIKWISKKPKHYTGADIDYSSSIANGHPYAGPHWDQRMWTAEKDKIIKEVQGAIGGK